MLPGEVPYLFFSILAKYIEGSDIGSDENEVRNSSMRGRSTTRRRIGRIRLEASQGSAFEVAYVSTDYWSVG